MSPFAQATSPPSSSIHPDILPTPALTETCSDSNAGLFFSHADDTTPPCERSGLKGHGCSWTDGEADSPDQNDAVSLAFRQALEELVVSNNRTSKSAVEDPLVIGLLDLSLAMALSGMVPKQLPMMCIHDLFEGLTARRCGDAFAFLEERTEKLQSLTLDKLSQAALLKSCNTLLQRLSKSSDLLLCGRILMFLANVLPLSERSGVNLKGEFNKNTTDYEEELGGEEAERMETEGSGESEFKLQSLDEKLEGQLEVSFNMYKTFWGLQKWLHSPPLLLTHPQVAVRSGITPCTMHRFCHLFHQQPQGRQQTTHSTLDPRPGPLPLVT
jgi:hypothetical protein